MNNSKEYNPYAIKVVSTVDPILDTTSRNAVENRVVAKKVLEIESKTDTIPEIDAGMRENAAEIAIIKESLNSTGGTSAENQQNLSKLSAEVANLKSKFDSGTGKLKTENLPDVILGNVAFRGIVTGFQNLTPKVIVTSEKGSSGIGNATLEKFLPTLELYRGGYLDPTLYHIPELGDYFINNAVNNLQWEGKVYNKGDWLIWQGGSVGWGKVDNTDAVSSVAGLTGTITVEALIAALNIYSKEEIKTTVNNSITATVNEVINTSY